ncbi:ATP-binding protein, partial [bacterium]|nr:ATP-binding protein [bacterium]
MNLSVLEQMARNGDMSVDALRYLLECKGECEWLDYKQALHIDTEKELCDFARDILAIKNMGGGYVVVGVEDKTWKPVGLSFTLPYDTKLIRDQVRRATGLDLEVDIVHHDIHVPSSSGKFALVFIRSSRKRSKRRTPTLCAKDFCHTKTYGLRRGEIYVRRGDSTIRLQHDSELVDLLERLEDQADHDSMTMAGPPSPFAVHDGLYRLLEKGFLKFIGRTEVRDQLLDVVTRDPRIWIINVHGPGGVGKSALVNWAVYEFYEKRSFESIIQLTAKEATLTPAGIRPHDRSLVSLENLLDQITLTFQHDPPDDLNEKKALTTQILSAWSTLIVLDNMETVRDGRILSFVQSLPPDTRAKVLLTSRQKSRGWELPFPVKELNVDDVQEFIQIRSREMRIDFPTDHNMAERTCLASGGLPLAIQWLLGRYKIRPDIDDVLASVGQKDSPILEFSFGN